MRQVLILAMALTALAAVDARPETDEEYLLGIARQTWSYFQECRDESTGLAWDHAGDGGADAGQYATPTNIGLQLCCFIAADDLGFITAEEAVAGISGLLGTVESLQKSRGFLLNSYNTKTAAPQGTFVSFVDNAWLSLSLVAVRQAYPDDLADRAIRLLDAQDYGTFYVARTGQMQHGYHTDRRDISYGHYAMFCSEPRAGSLYAICTKQAPETHWFRMERARPAAGKGYQEGAVRTYLGVRVQEDYYTYKGKKVVPSWGGSMFEFLMPTLFIDEAALAPRSLGANNRNAVDAQIAYARDRGFDVWGMSPSAKPEGGYGEYGAGPVGVQGYPGDAVTPHASVLALDIRPKEVILNLRRLESDYSMRGEHGFRDSVNPATRAVSKVYLALDQAMILIAIDNHLNKGAIRQRVMRDPVMKPARDLLGLETFYGLDEQAGPGCM